MKILTDLEWVYIENAKNTPEISEKHTETANRIFDIIDLKINRFNKNNSQEINPENYIQILALEKLETIRNLDCEREEKIKKIFNYIHWYYVAIAKFTTKNWLKISIPDNFRELTENPELLSNFELIICWDNPWNKEYEEDRWFNPNAKAWSILKNILNANSIQDENVLFFNKTFISTTSTKDLNKIPNKKLIKNTIEFNAQVLNLLSEILEKPVLILGWQNESIFKIFFESISEKFHLSPHTSMYKIFWNNKKINWWKEKFEAFKIKNKNIDIFTEKWYVSLKKINNFDKKTKEEILKEYFNSVILG